MLARVRLRLCPVTASDGDDVDLARATGQPYDPDPRDVAAILPFLEAFGSEQGVPGLFGPAVPVPDDAPAFDRALGLSGRDPAWRAPAPTGG